MKKNWMIVPVAVMIFLGSYSVRADVNYEYFEGTWDLVPDFDLLTPVKTGVQSGFTIDKRDRDELCGFRFTAYIDVATDGEYTFYTNSDDGSALYIGNSLVVNNDGTHGMTERSGSINLTTGKHAITVLFFNKGGAFGLEVNYEGPGIYKRAIPAGKLSLASRKASFPLPAHEAMGVDPTAALEWQEPELVDDAKFNVYFGTDPNLPESLRISTEQDETMTYPIEDDAMDQGTKYYWRVDVYDPNTGGNPAMITGTTWEFTVRYGLLALYEFEADPNDTSGNGYDGELQGDAQIVADALHGNVLSLGGNGVVGLVKPKTAAELGLGGNNPKSMTAWVYTREFNGGGLFDVGAHSDGQNFSLRTLDNDNTWRVQYHGGDYDIDFIFDSLNKWVHFALVHDGSYTRLYVNGMLRTEVPRVLNISGSDTFRIGQWGSDGFNGLIDDFAIWDYALSPEEIRRMVPAGDSDTDSDVDVADLEAFAGGWGDDNTTPVIPPVTLESFEGYSSGDIPNPLYGIWFQYANTDCLESSLTPSLLIGDPGAPQGNKALRTVFDYPASCGGDNNWLMMGSFLPVHVDMDQYDELRFWVRTHAGNEDDVVWHLQLASDYGGTPHLTVDIGPFSSTEEAGVWREIAVDLRNGNNVDWQSPYSKIDDVEYINAIVVTTVHEVASGIAGQITLDIDDIRLVDYTPGCADLPAADLNGDCVVDMIDFGILADQWMNTTHEETGDG
jgi:hypothetical protein